MLSAADIHLAHSAESLPTDVPTYLGIIAQLPRDEAPGQSAVPVSFWIQTDLSNDNTRTAQGALHAARLAAILNLFDDASFPSAVLAINKPATGSDARAWKGLGFTGWEFQAEEAQDGPEGTKYLAKLPFIFDAFLEDQTFPAIEPLLIETALKQFLVTQNLP